MVCNGRESKTLEEVADKYLSGQICRRLVLVSIVSIDGKAKHCHIHDLMREVILSITTEFNFCQVLEKEGSSFHGKSRRLSINNYGDEFLKAEKSQVLDDQSHGNSTKMRRYRYPLSISFFFDTRLGDQTGKIVGKFLHKGIASGHLFKVTDSKS